MAVIYNNPAGSAIWNDSVVSASFVNYEPDTTKIKLHTYPQSQEKSSTVTLKTKVVELKAGFVGQVLHSETYVAGGKIVWESAPKKSLAKAQKAADKAKDRAVARLFEGN